jgi:hypothetical protein
MQQLAPEIRPNTNESYSRSFGSNLSPDLANVTKIYCSFLQQKPACRFFIQHAHQSYIAFDRLKHFPTPEWAAFFTYLKSISHQSCGRVRAHATSSYIPFSATKSGSSIILNYF